LELKGKRSERLPRSRHCNADEGKLPTGLKSGKGASRMKLSQETCLKNNIVNITCGDERCRGFF